MGTDRFEQPRRHLRHRAVRDRSPGRPLRPPAHDRRHPRRRRRCGPDARRHRRAVHVPRWRRREPAGLRQRQPLRGAGCPGHHHHLAPGAGRGDGAAVLRPGSGGGHRPGPPRRDLAHRQGGQRGAQRRRAPGLRLHQARGRGPHGLAVAGGHALPRRPGRPLRHPLHARLRRHPRAAGLDPGDPAGARGAQPRRRLPDSADRRRLPRVAHDLDADLPVRLRRAGRRCHRHRGVRHRDGARPAGAGAHRGHGRRGRGPTVVGAVGGLQPGRVRRRRGDVGAHRPASRRCRRRPALRRVHDRGRLVARGHGLLRPGRGRGLRRRRRTASRSTASCRSTPGAGSSRAVGCTPAFGHTAEAVRQLRGEAGDRQVDGAEVVGGHQRGWHSRPARHS